MTTRNLNTRELVKANALLTEIRSHIDAWSGPDPALRSAYSRKIIRELTYELRGKPLLRKELKKAKWEEQGHACAICGTGMILKYGLLVLANDAGGYTKANTLLVHSTCGFTTQLNERYVAAK